MPAGKRGRKRLPIADSIAADPDRPLQLGEAANYLGVTRAHLYHLCSRGEIVHFKPAGKFLYFRRSDLNNYAFRNRRESREEIERQAAEHGWLLGKPGARRKLTASR